MAKAYYDCCRVYNHGLFQVFKCCLGFINYNHGMFQVLNSLGFRVMACYKCLGFVVLYLVTSFLSFRIYGLWSWSVPGGKGLGFWVLGL